MATHRTLGKLVKALGSPTHYKALAGMWRVYPEFKENLRRYLKGTGEYPYDCRIRTPMGEVAPTLHSYFDMLTANEIFCRRDYETGTDIRFVVDIGSNIGISALYFLTRNPDVYCWLYEPDPRNVVKLRHNLQGYEDRYELHECAVGNEAGTVSFGTEETGRYGGIGLDLAAKIEVKCEHVNAVLERAFEKAPTLDVLKLDTEGYEEATVGAIDPAHFPKIRRIYMEAPPGPPLHQAVFRERRYGSVRRLTNRSLA